MSDYNFDNTGILALTETWKLVTALFQLLFVITNGKIFPSDLNWAKKHDISDISFNMERCFINAIVACIEIHWYADAQNLTGNQVETYRKVVSNAQSQIIILHHVRVSVMNRLSKTSFVNAKLAEARRKKKQEMKLVEDPENVDSDDCSTSTSNNRCKGPAKKQRKSGPKKSISLDESEEDDDDGQTKIVQSSKKLAKASSSLETIMNRRKKKNTVDKFKPPSTLDCAKQGKRFYGTLKFHLLTHLPDQVMDFGSIKENVDTSIMESTNIDMTHSFDRTTKRYETTNKELLHISQRNYHIKSTVQLSEAMVQLVVKVSPKRQMKQVHSSYLLSIDNKKRPYLTRDKHSQKWTFGDINQLPWHPQFRMVCLYTFIYTYFLFFIFCLYYS